MKNVSKMVELAIEKAKKEDPILVGELTSLQQKPSYSVLCSFLVDNQHTDWLAELERLSVSNISMTDIVQEIEAIVSIKDAKNAIGAFNLTEAAKKYGIGILKIKMVSGAYQHLWPDVRTGLIPVAHVTGSQEGLTTLLEDAKGKNIILGYLVGESFKVGIKEFNEWP